MAPLIAHLERFLGPIARGWPHGEPPNRFTILEFVDAPSVGLATYATLGISDHPLTMGDGLLREELLLVRAVDSSGVGDRDAAALLIDAGEELLGRHRAILRDELVAARDRPPTATALHAFWARSPAFMPDEFAAFDAQPPLAFMWLVPVTASEAHVAVERGLSWLEALFELVQPDVYDFTRPSAL